MFVIVVIMIFIFNVVLFYINFLFDLLPSFYLIIKNQKRFNNIEILFLSLFIIIFHFERFSNFISIQL